MNMKFNIENGHAIYIFRIEELDTRANLCENIFYPESIKDDNGAVAMRNNFVRPEHNQQLYQFKKKDNIGEYKTC